MSEQDAIDYNILFDLRERDRSKFEEQIDKLTAENADLKKRVKELDEECEAQQYQFDILKKDPACVWANMLRGNIATPSALVEAHDYQQIKAENAALEAKVKVLREALEKIRDIDCNHNEPCGCLKEVWTIARKAIAESGGEK